MGVMVTAVESDRRDAGTVFECEWMESGAGSQGWGKPYFPSWEAERIANRFSDKFRWNTALVGPEGEPGNWEYEVETDGEWLPVPWLEEHGVGKWNMDPQAEWRMVKAPETAADLEDWHAHIDLAKSVYKAQEDHCNLQVSDMEYDTVHLPRLHD
jgi:hypothetical protein